MLETEMSFFNSDLEIRPAILIILQCNFHLSRQTKHLSKECVMLYHDPNIG